MTSLVGEAADEAAATFNGDHGEARNHKNVTLWGGHGAPPLARGRGEHGEECGGLAQGPAPADAADAGSAAPRDPWAAALRVGCGLCAPTGFVGDSVETDPVRTCPRPTFTEASPTGALRRCSGATRQKNRNRRSDPRPWKWGAGGEHGEEIHERRPH